MLPGVHHPLTLALLPEGPTATTDVRAAVDRARTAQIAWAARPLHERVDLVRQIGRAIVERRHEIAAILADETGRTPTEALLNEVIALLPAIEGHVRVVKENVVPERIRLSALDHPGKSLAVEPVPRGVVGIIAPWNYPLSNFFKSLFLAMLSGNAVVLKPSEWTPRAGAWLAAQCAEVVGDVVVPVFGDGAVGSALIDSGVDALVFTGSVATGRKVAAAAGERLVPVSLELGGKDAAIVLADCDLERTVAGVAKWALTNAGQDCSSIERVYVEEAIADRFVGLLVGFVSRLEIPKDLGPLQNERQLRIVEAHVADAVAAGAQVLCGGSRTGQGWAFSPTVLDRCTNAMTVVREETFGPVIPIVRVADVEEAVRLANDNDYGLGASVWTKDAARGAAIARRLAVGMAWVNNHSITSTMTEAPWTGTKASGTGVAQSRHALPTFVRWRTLLVDTNKDPDAWWMPADASLDQLVDAVSRRSLGSIGATLSLLGILGRRVRAIRAALRQKS